MLGSVRRYGVVHALRASASRSLYARSTPQLLRWQAPSSTALPQISRSLFHSSPLRSSAAAAATAAPEQTDGAADALPERLTLFPDLARHGLIDRKIIKNITDMKITTMTDVQSLTINETLKGGDVLAQAKTGTGKTIAFLLPILQNILNDPTVQRGSSGRNGRRSTGADVRAIVISPTRELAEQIAAEAQKLAQGTGIVVQTAVGGTMKRQGLFRIQNQGCHLLVGTPGRLKDILSDRQSGVQTPKLSSFVLDEADRLLDDGFAPEIAEIQRYLPDPMQVDRQTLMFSATVPREVMGMVRRSMKSNFQFVKTVRDDEVPTHLSVPQKVVRLDGLQNALPAVLELAKNCQLSASNDRPFKAIVYFNSTAQVSIASQTFKNLHGEINGRMGHPLGKMRMFEIHSRLSQARRTIAADSFRASRSGILFSSDVTARGMDFPNVTHVIQVGTPRDRETYIHRLGRTARAQKTGEGWLLLHSAELRDVHSKLRDLPIQQDNTLPTAQVNITGDDITDSSDDVAATVAEVRAAMENVPEYMKADAYKSQLGTLISVFERKSDMVDALNELATHGYGLSQPPHIGHSIAQKMGLSRVRGLNLGHSTMAERPPQDDEFSPRGRGFSSRGGRESRPSFGRRDSNREYGGDFSRGPPRRSGGGGGGGGRDREQKFRSRERY